MVVRSWPYLFWSYDGIARFHFDNPWNTTETGVVRVRSLLLPVLLLLAGCDDRPGGWSAIVYPDRTDRTKFVVTPRFTMLSYCLEAAKEKMNAIQINGHGDYECGYNCEEYGDPHRMNVCEKIRR